jgi:Holliday junction resolvasome RuvABC DNA-binding subunit
MAVKSLEVEVGKMTKPRGILSMIKTKFPSFQALKLANADDLQSIKGIGAATAKRMVSALDDILNVPVVFDEENFISNADEQTLDVDPNGLSTLEMQQLLNSENVNV